jgi:hypothetical protein
VIDLEGHGVGGVTLALVEEGSQLSVDSLRAASDSQGRFFFPASRGRGVLVCDDRRYAAVFSSIGYSLAGAEDLVMVVAPRLELAGRVVDERGAPLHGAHVRVLPPDDLRANMRRVLDGVSIVELSAKSDADGGFSLPTVPSMTGATISAALDGFETASQALPSNSRTDLVLELAPAAGIVAGLVVRDDGTPCPDAWVALGEVTTRSDPDGKFRLQVGNPQSPGRDAEARILRAVAQGRLPAELLCAKASPLDPGAWPDPLVLRLGGAPLAIRGRVLDADGAPVAGAEVTNLDRQPFGMIEHTVSGTQFFVQGDVETLLAGGGFRRSSVTTDADGRFAIESLQPRAYRLRALDPRTLSTLTTAPIQAGGADAELRLSAEPRRARISGVVVSLTGEPVSRATVRATRDIEAAVFDDAYGELSGAPVKTDDEGRFELRDVARAAQRLRINVEGNPRGTTVDLEAAEDVESLRISVPLSCHLQVDLRESKVDADTLRVLDAKGEAVDLLTDLGGLSFSAQRVGLHDGLSDTISLSQAAATIVLLRGEQEVARFPVVLKPGILNIERP